MMILYRTGFAGFFFCFFFYIFYLINFFFFSLRFISFPAYVSTPMLSLSLYIRGEFMCSGMQNCLLHCIGIQLGPVPSWLIGGKEEPSNWHPYLTLEAFLVVLFLSLYSFLFICLLLGWLRLPCMSSKASWNSTCSPILNCASLHPFEMLSTNSLSDEALWGANMWNVLSTP